MMHTVLRVKSLILAEDIPQTVAITNNTCTFNSDLRLRKLMTNIQEQIEQELQKAREICNTDGASPGECAAAWDAVEELQAEASHQRQIHPEKNSLEKYCDENPDAAECRLYED
jgi:hypothetical protein